MGYNFNVKIETKNFTIEIAEGDLYGCFEHNRLGEDRGGGLWFQMCQDKKLDLIDYDGTAYLPKEVLFALRDKGYTVDETFE